MKKAYNEHGKLVDIIDSVKGKKYKCPVCKEVLNRRFGLHNQYFAHPKGVGEVCELKFKLIEKKPSIQYTPDAVELLDREYIKKKFNTNSIELSDYFAEEDYLLTKEQKNIICSKEDRVKVSALAGSAKTSTLYYYCKERPFKKILYLVYNKAMKDEAMKTFGKLSHVEIKTTHGLAYADVGRFYKNKLVFSYGVVDIIKDLNLHWNNDIELATKVNLMMTEYMLSDKLTFDSLDLFLDEHGHSTVERDNIITHCNRLWKLKEEYYNNVKVEHDFYLKLFQLKQVDMSDRYDIICLDECLPASQYVKTQDGLVKIKKLYEMYEKKEKTPLILSYNADTDLFEYKPMVWAKKSENRQLLEIATEGLNRLQCTENHKILTQRGYVMAKDLVIGKDILVLDNPNNQKAKYKLNTDQLQILLGSFLGDGHLQKQSKFNTYRLRFTQGMKQFEYFKQKISAYELGYNKIKSGYTGEESVYMSDFTKVFLLDNNVWQMLKHIDLLGLAIWYQDDGSYSKRSKLVTINSNQLTYQQTKYIRDVVYEKFDIDFNISKSKNKYYYLRLNVPESNKFLKLVSAYMHPCMQYKTNIDISNNNINFNDKYLNHGGNYVKQIKKLGFEDVYDIEVSDNHNFVTTRSYSDTASGIVVHNCQDSNMLVLDVLHNSKVKGIVMIGDPFQQLYGWRNAINIMPRFKGTEYKLTTSFRVSQNIANIANILVKDVTGKDINMKGFNQRQTIVASIDKSKPYVCLCRTNSYIFSEVFDIVHSRRNAKLFFEGGYNSYNFQNIKDAYYFSLGYSVKNNMFNKFENYNQMVKYAKDVEDLELLSLDRMIYRYGSQIPDVVDSIKYNTTTDKKKADVLFSTMHRSKGMTYTMPVYISDDHFNIANSYTKHYIEKDKTHNIKKEYEEMCVLYVAITRAAGQIQLSDRVLEYLIIRYNFLKGGKK